jgi:hypothetical protein
MITIQGNGSLAWNSLTDPDHQVVGTLELPADLLEQQSDLLNRVLAFAFDVLGLHTLDLRIRPYREETYADHPEDSVWRSGDGTSKGSNLLGRQDTLTGRA